MLRFIVFYLHLCSVASLDLSFLNGLGELFQGDVTSLVNGFKPMMDCNTAGKDYLLQRKPGCFAKLLKNQGTVNALIVNSVTAGIATALKHCECDKKQLQMNNLFGTMTSMLKGDMNLGTILSSLRQNCKVEAEKQICAELVSEMDNRDCSVCRFMKLATDSDNLSNCVCDHFQGKAFYTPDKLRAAITKCVVGETVEGVLMKVLGFQC